MSTVPGVPAVTVTYYLDVLSSWCHWAEPAWDDLQRHFSGVVGFDWAIAEMDPGAMPADRAACDWFYRRSGTLRRSPVMLSSSWLESARPETLGIPNRIAWAARNLGFSGDGVRRALAEAALLHGLPVCDLPEAARVAAQASGFDAHQLMQASQAPGTAASIEASTAAFRAFNVSMRPTFTLTSAIGDRAIFSGLVDAAPLAAALDAMLRDSDGYRSFEAHFGAGPS